MSEPNPKWKIIHIQVKEDNQIIPIDFKLSNTVKQVKGIQFHVKELLNTAVEYIPQVGELSLMMNAKSQHPLHFTADYNKDLSDKKASLKLDCEIKDNSNITGFYLDYGTIKNAANVFLPYSLSIYLECSSSPLETTKEQ